MLSPDPNRADGPCERTREAARELAAADARCRSAVEGEKEAAFAAYRAAFGAYCDAQAACREERMRSRR
jgi:hypothetical protein